MKRQISISIFLAILVIAFAWFYIKFSNETNPKENMIQTENEVLDEQSVTISQEYISSKFYVKEEYGKLVIYESKKQEIYMETSIDVRSLSFELQDKIKNGIFFQSETELYDFLENYSS